MADPAQGNIPELSVSDLAFAVKRTVEDAFPYVRLRGEVSGYRGPHSSGHCYFALKDEKARIDAIIWKGVFGRLRFKPEEGMEVIATGKVTTYPGRSSYQIVIESLEPAGVGALMALLEERRRKLAAEGLFDESRKVPLPYLPRVIGVVTSPTGAVIRDILHRISDRFPVRVLVWPARVQGEGAEDEIAAGIRGFNALADGGPIPRPDVIIAARGGGSLEDLWCFNEEIVVRAAAESRIPIVSAVGHETDWTLIDHVADIRAPTPTAAAEMAVPVRTELIAVVADRGQRLKTGLMRLVQERKAHLRAATRGLPRLTDLLALPRQRFDEAAGRLGRALMANTHAHGTRLVRASGRLSPGRITDRIVRGQERVATLQSRVGRAMSVLVERRKDRLARVATLLDALSYEQTLKRGYALVRDAAGEMVRTAKGHATGDRLEIRFADGTLPVAVDGSTPRPGRSGADVKTADAQKKAGQKPGRQASLFDD
ncbi:exodeoxyribonuclease VII large subunit [Microbaculum sp. FT89]|uniref:exodeoxyribonuclease VII large subunit n=1 Tax=Microbaculum sp. FT89 TaxID=3447298 RepID=UPI003F5360B8